MKQVLRQPVSLEKSQEKKRYIGLEWLRVFSTLYIVAFWHLFGYTQAQIQGSELNYRITIAALATFVLLSGFLITRGEPISIRQFILRRFLRVYPLFVFATIVFFILHIGSRIAQIKGVFLLPMFWEPAPATLWFICMIVLLYMVAPLLWRLRDDARVFCAVAGAIEIVLLAYEYATGLLDSRLAIYFPAFAFGVFLAGGRFPINAKVASILAAATAISVIPTIGIPQEEIGFSLRVTAFAMFASATVFVVVLLAEKYFRKSAVISVLGEASFLIYLLHRPVFDVLLRIFTPSSDGLMIAYLLCVGMPITVFVSLVLQRGYDRLLTRLLAGKQPAPMADRSPASAGGHAE